jgi:hypothetical protein
MSYTNVQTGGNSYKRLKALVSLGIPFGPEFPVVDVEDGTVIFILTDAEFNNGVPYYWDMSAWKKIAADASGSDVGNVDGGVASSIYLIDQIYDGGSA